MRKRSSNFLSIIYLALGGASSLPGTAEADGAAGSGNAPMGLVAPRGSAIAIGRRYLREQPQTRAELAGVLGLPGNPAGLGPDETLAHRTRLLAQHRKDCSEDRVEELPCAADVARHRRGGG